MTRLDRKKGWYFVKVASGEKMTNGQWVPAHQWRPAFWNPDGFSTPKWFHADSADEIAADCIVQVSEIEASSACGVDWSER
jgi:hypothetical protein